MSNGACPVVISPEVERALREMSDAAFAELRKAPGILSGPPRCMEHGLLVPCACCASALAILTDEHARHDDRPDDIVRHGLNLASGAQACGLDAREVSAALAKARAVE